MSVTAIQAVIENGQIRLPPGVTLPEQSTVYVVVPDTTPPVPARVPGVGLANPADAAKFEMKVTWGDAR